MPLTRNAVFIEENEDSLFFAIKLIHPKGYKFILAMLFGLSIVGILLLITVVNIFKELGHMSLFPLGISLLLSYFLFKIYMWHDRGEELFLLAVDNFTYQINNGIKLSELKSFEALNYHIDFLETNVYESTTCGKIYFYTVDPKTKLKYIIMDSTLEIAFEEFELLERKYNEIKERSVNILTNISLN